MRVSPKTRMSEPDQVTCGPIVLEMAMNSFWPSGVTPAVNAWTRRRFSSTALRFLVAIWKGGRVSEWVSYLRESQATHSLYVEEWRGIWYRGHFLLNVHLAA